MWIEFGNCSCEVFYSSVLQGNEYQKRACLEDIKRNIVTYVGMPWVVLRSSRKKKKNESQLMLWRSKVPVLNLIWPCVYIGSYGLEVTYMPNTLCLYQRRPWAINGICYLYLCGITYLGVYRGKKQICHVTA